MIKKIKFPIFFIWLIILLTKVETPMSLIIMLLQIRIGGENVISNIATYLDLMLHQHKQYLLIVGELDELVLKVGHRLLQ